MGFGIPQHHGPAPLHPAEPVGRSRAHNLLLFSPLTPYSGIGLRWLTWPHGQVVGIQSKNNMPAGAAVSARQRGMPVSGLDAILKTLLPATRVIDGINAWIGKRVAWLILVAVAVSAANASVRKIFDTSSNSWLELQWVLFSVVFLLCSPWTLLDNEHIRIDIVNNLLPKRVRNIIDTVGHAFFLLPLTVIMLLTGVPFFLNSIEINEQSSNAGGLPQWPAKSLIMIGFAMLFVQGISELVKRIAVMRDLIPDPHVTQHHGIEAEIEHIVEAIEKH
jgi:TRAP-type mannitol/chloroaromatic compound transport system permease small subunit